jgi:hypothetical protein
MPTETLSGIFKDFFRAGTKVVELMLLHEYIIHPTHADLAAWQAFG